MSYHVELSPSKAERWINCPGSIQLSKEREEPQTSYATEGAVAHWLAENKLRNPHYDLDKAEGTVKDGVKITREMIDHITEYTGWVNGTRIANQFAVEGIEQRVHFKTKSPLPSEMSGTPDYWGFMHKAGVLLVVDLKYGAGKYVDVNDWQFKCYAVYAYSMLSEKQKKECDLIHVRIFQPRFSSPDEDAWRDKYYNIDEIKEFASKLIEASWKTVQPDAEIKVGSWCQWCPAAAICPAQREAAHEAAQDVFAEQNERDVSTLTDEELARVITLIPTVKSWLNKVEQYVEARLASGNAVPGLKLVQKKTHRRWKNPEEMEKQFAELGDRLFDRKIKSPAQVEKMIPKADKKLVEGLTYKPFAVTVVPESDPRPGLGDVRDMFEADKHGDEEND